MTDRFDARNFFQQFSNRRNQNNTGSSNNSGSGGNQQRRNTSQPNRNQNRNTNQSSNTRHGNSGVNQQYGRPSNQPRHQNQSQGRSSNRGGSSQNSQNRSERTGNVFNDMFNNFRMPSFNPPQFPNFGFGSPSRNRTQRNQRSNVYDQGNQNRNQRSNVYNQGNSNNNRRTNNSGGNVFENIQDWFGNTGNRNQNQSQPRFQYNNRPGTFGTDDIFGFGRRQQSQHDSTEYEPASGPSGPPPTATKALKELPTFPFTYARSKRLKHCGEGSECVICLDEFKFNQKISLLPCQHIFHGNCIKEWLSRHNTCPVCRYELPLSDPTLEKTRRERMIKKFSGNGIKIMELGMDSERIFVKVEEALSKYYRKMTNGPNTQQVIRLLNQANSKLFQMITTLDTFEGFKDVRTRDERRSLIRKIQAMHKIIDSNLENIKSNTSQRNQRQNSTNNNNNNNNNRNNSNSSFGNQRMGRMNNNNNNNNNFNRGNRNNNFSRQV